MTDRTFWRLLILVTAFAWGLRITVSERFIGLSAPIDPADGMDESDYELFAWQMSRGVGYVLEDGTPSARRPPGTSLIILPVYLLFGRSLFAARLWMTLLSAINCAAAAWVVRRHGGARIALLTAAAMAADPGLFYYSLHLWSEVPFSLAITLAVGSVQRAVEFGSAKWSFLAGLCWGLSVLLRPQILLIGPCVLIGLWFWHAAQRNILTGELLREGLIVVVMISPWMLRNWVVIGTPALATLVGGHTFWGAHNGSTFHDARYRGYWHPYDYDPGVTFPLTGPERQQERQAWSNGWKCVRLYGKELPQLVVWKLYRLVTPFEPTRNRFVYWAFAVAWIVMLPLIVIGLPRLRHLDPWLCWWIGVLLGGLLLCTVIFYGAARFRHVLDPFLMMAWAAGADSLMRRIRRTDPEAAVDSPASAGR
jgi:4-amino-4-deoxy-L-arabinose transferase-like glycosyltransferase